MFIIGCSVIISLMFLFDASKTFTTNFTKRITYLIVLSGLVSFNFFVIYFLLTREGGPGPGLAILIIGVLMCIDVLMAVLYLIRHTINESIEMREERKLTI